MSDPPSNLDERLLARFVPMSALGETHLRELSQHAEMLELSPGQVLAEELMRVESILYLVDGVLCLTGGNQPDELVKSTDPGSRFALPNAEASGRYARAVVPSRVLRVERAKVSTLLIWAQASGADGATRDPDRAQADITALLLQSRLFERIPPGNIERIGELIESVSVSAGQTVIRQGEAGEHYYVIERGRCEVLRETEDGGEPLCLAQLDAGDSFGEEALLTDSRRNATVRMLTDGMVLRLTREYFQELVSEPLLQQVSHERAEDLVATGARWLDVRLPEEFERDGIQGAVNLPLSRLRAHAGELAPGASYVVYCNTGRRAHAGAFLLSQRGVHACSLREGIARRRPVSRTPHVAGDSLSALQAQLMQANAELDQALEHKAEADAAREVEARVLGDDQEAHSEAQSRLSQLQADARKASDSLRAAVARKRDLESRVRDAQAQATSLRRAAQVECERMRAQTRARLEAEKQQLTRYYQEASEKLREIERSRHEAEARFEEERQRLEKELEQARARMAAEAARVRAAIETARQDAQARADAIRNEHLGQEERLRHQTELALREERARLADEFARSVSAQESARHALDEVEAARVAAEHEAERLRAQQAQAARARRAREAERREAEVRRLRERSEAARARLEAARKEHAQAKARHRNFSANLTGTTGDGSPDDAAMRDELEGAQQALAGANDALNEALAAHASAEQAHSIAEATAATARTRAEELRLQLYEEMEDWMGEEEKRSGQELERAAQFAREFERLQAEKESKRALAEQATASMLSDIQAVLSGAQGEDALGELMRSRMVAEEKARLVRKARHEAAQEIERARAALSRRQDGKTRD